MSMIRRKASFPMEAAEIDLEQLVYALDVQMRRGWYAMPYQERRDFWIPHSHNERENLKLNGFVGKSDFWEKAKTPYTVLVEADKWWVQQEAEEAEQEKAVDLYYGRQGAYQELAQRFRGPEELVSEEGYLILSSWSASENKINESAKKIVRQARACAGNNHGRFRIVAID